MMLAKSEELIFDRNQSILSIRSKAELVEMAAELFGREGTCARLEIPPAVLRRFIKSIARHYKSNHYHNFHHAVDTINTVGWMVTQPRLRDNLPELHRYVLMISGLVHDAGHPGHNNQWEVNTNSALAKRYQDASVLENYSLEIARELMADREFNVFSNHNGKSLEGAQEILNDLVLATDFALHRGFLDEFIDWLDNKPQDFSDPRFLSLVSRAVMKAADIANTSKNFVHAKYWGLRVMKEFWAQGWLEKEHNLPVGPLNDPDTVRLNSAQAGFIKFAALELFDLLGRVEPNIGVMADTLRTNLHLYEILAEADS